MNRVAIARNTLEILDAGYYRAPSGKRVDLASEVRSCSEKTQCFDGEMLSEIRDRVFRETPRFSNQKIEVRNETTLAGAERMASSGQFEKIGVLNFASARNPGGGFLNGAKAQEESLARSSALYPSLLRCPEYYDFHRSHKSLLYSDRTIYSPGCPVFKRDDGTLLEHPYWVDFITSPAPNAGAIARNQPENLNPIETVLRDRGQKFLSLAVYQGCNALVLGAWGCGVFKNDPEMVSQLFADLLGCDRPFENRFKMVLFSVLDTTPAQKIISAFQNQF